MLFLGQHIIRFFKRISFPFSGLFFGSLLAGTTFVAETQGASIIAALLAVKAVLARVLFSSFLLRFGYVKLTLESGYLDKRHDNAPALKVIVWNRFL